MFRENEDENWQSILLDPTIPFSPVMGQAKAYSNITNLLMVPPCLDLSSHTRRSRSEKIPHIQSKIVVAHAHDWAITAHPGLTFSKQFSSFCLRFDLLLVILGDSKLNHSAVLNCFSFWRAFICRVMSPQQFCIKGHII